MGSLATPGNKDQEDQLLTRIATQSSKTGSREGDSQSAAQSNPSRYGNETLVLSPELLMVKVPADCTGV